MNRRSIPTGRIILPTSSMIKEYCIFEEQLAFTPVLVEVTAKSVFADVVAAIAAEAREPLPANMTDMEGRGLLPYQQIMSLVTEPIFRSFEFNRANGEDQYDYAFVLEHAIMKYYLFLLQWTERCGFTQHQIDNMSFCHWHGFDAVLQFPDT